MQICRGYIWQNGLMTDINELLPDDSPLYVLLAMAINNEGQIAGLAVDLETGEPHAFLATPAAGRAGQLAARDSLRPRARPHLFQRLTMSEALQHRIAQRVH
jgi:hypothetical protein